MCKKKYIKCAKKAHLMYIKCEKSTLNVQKKVHKMYKKANVALNRLTVNGVQRSQH